MSFHFFQDYGALISRGALLSWCSEKYMLPVINQQEIHSCATFVTTAALAALVAVENDKCPRVLVYERVPDSSKQEMVDCLFLDRKGVRYETCYDYIRDYGLHSEVDYSYEGKIGLPCRCYLLQGRVKLSVWGYDFLTTEMEIFSNLARQPLTAGIKLYPSYFCHRPPFKNEEQLMGVYSHVSGENPVTYRDEYGIRHEMYHAVLVIGYGYHHGARYFIIKNTLGLEWGLLGYARIAPEELGWFGRPRLPRLLRNGVLVGESFLQN